MTPCLTSGGRPTAVGMIFLLLLALVACTGGDVTRDPAAVETEPVDPAVLEGVLEAFVTYRLGVTQGDSDAVLQSITEASIADQQRVVDLALTATEEEVHALPASDQLTLLTYRLRPQLLETEDPFVALVEGGLAGQDRTLGEIGDVEQVNDELAVADVLANETLAPTPLRWRFQKEDDGWAFDLLDAQRLVSQAVANTARLSEVAVSDVVTATLVDLSGEDLETIRALYGELPDAAE